MRKNYILTITVAFLLAIMLLNSAFALVFILTMGTRLYLASGQSSTNSLTLFNFTTDGIADWTEQSDATVRSAGLSKATIVIANNTDYRRAVFFALLNQQTDGSGFAGMRVQGTNFNISQYSNLQIQCRGQGNYTNFKIVLRHLGQNSDLNNTYEQIFAAPTENFAVVELPLADFTPRFRGQEVVNGTALDTSYISGIAVQFFGGIYLNVSQEGPASLEIDWIEAV